MSIFSVVISALLAVVGVAIAGTLLWLLFHPLFRSLRDRFDARKFSRAAERLAEADALISEKHYPQALHALRLAPLYELTNKPEFAGLIREHHQNILSRCVLIAEELQVRPGNLPDVERLIIERGELHTLYTRALDSYLSLQSRRTRAGKDVPQWSKSDFEQRILDIRQELEVNRNGLEKAFDKLFHSIESPPKESGDIVYH